MTDIGMSELVIPDSVNDVSLEKISVIDNGTARSPLSDNWIDTEKLNADLIVGLDPRHQEICVTDQRVVA